MKARRFFAIVVLLAAGIVFGATTTRRSEPMPTQAGEHRLIAEGMVKVAFFRDLQGWTSGEGSGMHSNEHRHAKLYDDFLIVTKPQEKGFGTMVMPIASVVEVQFEGQ